MEGASHHFPVRFRNLNRVFTARTDAIFVSSSRIRLTRIIAFNWYGFRTIIDVNGLTLLCGETGTGKSALLDLIQFVLSAGAVKFNKAAAGESNARDLVGYCLCDTNTRRKDGQPRYIRSSGATIAALEFSWPAKPGEEPRQETWGIRVQFESPSAQPSYIRFVVPKRMERVDLCDETGALLSEELFRSRVKRELGGDAGFTTHKSFQEEMGVARHLHFDDEQMRKTLPKAIAFELDADYQTFIRRFILEPNPPDVTNTRKSLDALRQAEARVTQLNDQQERLGRIATENASYQNAARETAIFGYLHLALDHAEAEETHAGVEKAIQTLREQHAGNERQMNDAVAAKEAAKKDLDAVKLLAGREDSQFPEFERITRERDDLAKEEKQLSGRAKTIREFLNQKARGWDQWFNDASVLPWSITVDGAKLSALRDSNVSRALEGVAPLAEEFRRIWDEAKDHLQPKLNEIPQLAEKQKRLKADLDQLDRGRTAATPLADKLRGLGTKADSLARVIEVSPAGEAWWGVIESLLGDEKNAVLVETETAFKQAHELWLALPKAEPLIQPGKIPEQELAPNSLASLLDTKHPIARRVLDWKLGQIVAVRESAELMYHPRAITPDGSVHDTAVLRRITPEKDLTLGEEGLRRLRAIKQTEFDDVSSRLKEFEEERDNVQTWIRLGKEKHLDQNILPENAFELSRLPDLQADLDTTNRTIELLTTPDRQQRLEGLRKLESRVTAADQTIGRLTAPISQFQIQLQKLKDDLESAKAEVQTASIAQQELRAKLPSGIPETTLADQLEEAKKSANTWKQRRVQAAAGREHWRKELGEAKERRQQQRRELLLAHRDEFIEFDLDEEDNERFDRRLEQIRDTEVQEFKALASERRADWEKRLQEDVLDRLRERLKDAQYTIGDFRRILKRKIGGYRYHLSQTRDPVHRTIWKLLDQSIEGAQAGEALFDWKLQEEIKQAKLDLMTAVENPDDKRAAALLDYRNYHHYDFKMLPADHEDDSEGIISLQDKGGNLSGGEGQAPFFVAMLSAFHRVYDHGQRGSQSNLGLVVMDEAFSKLSAGHIADCLSLAEGFGMQLILAFPMDRLGTMVQHSDSIIQCRVKRTADAKGAPIGIINDVIYWERDRVLTDLLA
jgi:hypothetical protein